MIRATMLYLLISVLVTAAAAWVLMLVYPGDDARRAILTSAGIATGVQLVAFLVLQLSRGKNVMAGWGVGALLRFASLGVYAMVVTAALGLDKNSALVSLACFLFLSMLIEPLLVNV